MKYGIVVDSACDLTGLEQKRAQNIDFTRVALKLDIGEQEFVDDLNLNIEEFMDAMYAYKGKTGSAAPSPQEWMNAFEKSEYIFAITITSALSGSYGSAKTAVDLFKEHYPDRKIHLIDSKSTGPGMTLIVHKLTEYMNQDMSFEEIVEKIDAYCNHVNLLFVLKSLDNLVKNGRISKLAGSIAGMLGIKLLGTATPTGDLGVVQKCRGKLTAYNRLIEEMITRGYKGGTVTIAHCFALDTAEYIASCLKEKFPECAIEIMPTSGLCSYYSEQGGILVGFES